MSIVFIGTPAFAVPSLLRLLDTGHEIALVITQPDRPAGRRRKTLSSPVKEAALEAGLTVLQPASLRDPAAMHEVAALEPEAMVAVAYGQILRQEFLDIAPRGVLNVHPSLLPRFRGASPIPAAILAGDEVTGVTIILMDAGMDSGPMLAQRIHAIWPVDTTDSLSPVLSELGASLLAETLPRWLSGEITPRPQDESSATVTRLLTKADSLIDWVRPAVEIWRQVRAYNPWPGAHTLVDGALLHIWQAWPLEGSSETEPGTVIGIASGRPDAMPAELAAPAFAVQTGDGLLAPVELQREGRKRLSAPAYLRGMPGLIGRRLGK